MLLSIADSIRAPALFLDRVCQSDGAVEVLRPFEILWLAFEMDFRSLVGQQLWPREDAIVEKGTVALQLHSIATVAAARAAVAGIACLEVLER